MPRTIEENMKAIDTGAARELIAQLLSTVDSMGFTAPELMPARQQVAATILNKTAIALGLEFRGDGQAAPARVAATGLTPSAMTRLEFETWAVAEIAKLPSPVAKANVKHAIDGFRDYLAGATTLLFDSVHPGEFPACVDTMMRICGAICTLAPRAEEADAAAEEEA